MQKRRSNDVHWARWFLRQMILPLLIAMIGTGAGSYLIAQEREKGWERVDAFRDMDEDHASLMEEVKCLGKENTPMIQGSFGSDPESTG